MNSLTQSLVCVIPRYDLATVDARLSLKRASIDTEHRNVRKKNIIAAGLPQSFRQEVARALESEPDAIGWLPSMPSVEEYLIGADPPPDVFVLSPQVREADAFNMAEFVARTSPGVAVVMARDHSSSSEGFSGQGLLWDVVHLTDGSATLRDAIERAMDSTGTSATRSPSTRISVHRTGEAGSRHLEGGHMGAIDQNQLPYPGLVLAITRRSGRPVIEMVDAITAGSAQQYPKRFKQPGGHIKDSEGVLAFLEDSVTFYADSGMVSAWPYVHMRSYSVKHGMMLWKLTIRGEGFKEVLRIGHDLAANAQYILGAKGLATE